MASETIIFLVLFSHWWKGKDQKRQGWSNFCYLELFLKVCLVRLSWVGCHTPLHHHTICFSIRCSETPEVVTSLRWTCTTHRSQMGIWLLMPSMPLWWGRGSVASSSGMVLPGSVLCWVVCLGERADLCAQQKKTCDCWVWSEDKIF